MRQITIYAAFESPRLHYVLEWLFAEQLQLEYRLITDGNGTDGTSPAIAYGRELAGGLHIPDTGLLRERTIERGRHPGTGTWEDVPVLFAQHGEVPFDLFSAVFFLLSRYEEYDPYTPDRHGRYPAAASRLHRNGWLERPLVDEWIHRLRKLLRSRFAMEIPDPVFRFLPTYDIDIAWSYRHKGWMRNAGGALKDLLRGDGQKLRDRIGALRGLRKDPYDAFDKMKRWHEACGLKPLYFILAAQETSRYDKNIPLRHYAMKELVKRLSEEGTIGIHPSYYSGEDERRFAEEKRSLEQAAGTDIILSRQHYVKMILPVTYRRLIQQGIAEDYSMGYGTHPGFRAGCSRSFLWYDLEQEKKTALRVHPFGFMDTTAKYDCAWDAATAFAKLAGLQQRLQLCGGRLITIFHNFSLGSDREWTGWDNAYSDFLESMR